MKLEKRQARKCVVAPRTLGFASRICLPERIMPPDLPPDFVLAEPTFCLGRAHCFGRAHILAVSQVKLTSRLGRAHILAEPTFFLWKLQLTENKSSLGFVTRIVCDDLAEPTFGNCIWKCTAFFPTSNSRTPHWKRRNRFTSVKYNIRTPYFFFSRSFRKRGIFQVGGTGGFGSLSLGPTAPPATRCKAEALASQP